MPLQVNARNGGRLISRGHGRHLSRIIDTWELIFVLDNKLEMFVGEENFEIPAEHCLLLPPGIRHGGRGSYAPDLSFFWVHFLPGNRKSEQHLNKMQRCFKVSNPARLSEYFQLFLSQQEESPEDGEGRNMILQLILHEAERQSGVSEANQDLPPLLQRLRRTLSLRFREPLSTSLLAEELQCNPDYLGRLYRHYFNESITDTLNAIRIHHAAALLRDTPLNVMQITNEVGFNDAAYFRRRFFRRYAMSPGAYRKLKSPGHVNTE